MERLNRFRVLFAATIAIILISVSFTLKTEVTNKTGINDDFYPFIIGFLSLILSMISATFFLEQLIKLTFFRKLIYGNRFIEGFWLFESILINRDISIENESDELKSFLKPGIGEIFYDKNRKGLIVSFYRYHPNISTYESIINSNTVTFDDVNLRYVNQFTFGLIEGTAFGKFSISPGYSYPHISNQ